MRSNWKTALGGLPRLSLISSCALSFLTSLDSIQVSSISPVPIAEDQCRRSQPSRPTLPRVQRDMAARRSLVGVFFFLCRACRAFPRHRRVIVDRCMGQVAFFFAVETDVWRSRMGSCCVCTEKKAKWCLAFTVLDGTAILVAALSLKRGCRTTMRALGAATGLVVP